MRLPPLEHIDHSAGWQIDGHTPSGLKKILHELGMKHHNNSGNQVFRTTDVQVTISNYGSIIDRVLFLYRGPKTAEITLFSDTPKNALPYEGAIDQILMDEKVSYTRH